MDSGVWRLFWAFSSSSYSLILDTSLSNSISTLPSLSPTWFPLEVSCSSGYSWLKQLLPRYRPIVSVEHEVEDCGWVTSYSKASGTDANIVFTPLAPNLSSLAFPDISKIRSLRRTQSRGLHSQQDRVPFRTRFRRCSSDSEGESVDIGIENTVKFKSKITISRQPFPRLKTALIREKAGQVRLLPSAKWFVSIFGTHASGA